MLFIFPVRHKSYAREKKSKKRNPLKWWNVYFPRAFSEPFPSLFARCKTLRIRLLCTEEFQELSYMNYPLMNQPRNYYYNHPGAFLFFVFCFLEITKPGQSGGELCNEVVHKTVWRTIWWWPNPGTTATTTMVFILVAITPLGGISGNYEGAQIRQH